MFYFKKRLYNALMNIDFSMIDDCREIECLLISKCQGETSKKSGIFSFYLEYQNEKQIIGYIHFDYDFKKYIFKFSKLLNRHSRKLIKSSLIKIVKTEEKKIKEQNTKHQSCCINKKDFNEFIKINFVIGK